MLFGIQFTDASAADAITTESSSMVGRISELLDSAADEGFSGAVWREKDDALIFEQAYGLANPREEITFTIGTVHQIGSISKQFTAVAAAKLATENKLDLHVPISTYVEGHSYLSEITLHQALTHSAGLPDYCGDDFANRSREEVFNYCLRRVISSDNTGEVSYSNLGYILAAAVIEEVTGQLFENYLETEILNPLGLDETGYFFPSKDTAEFAHGKRRRRRQEENIAIELAELEGDHWNIMGSGGMQSTLHDMRVWKSALMSESSLDPAIRENVLTPHAMEAENLYVGYGWYVRSTSENQIRQYSHSGSDGMFFSYLLVRPLENLSLYFVGSNGEEEALTVLREILAALPG